MIRCHFQRQASHYEQLIEKLLHVVVSLCGCLHENTAIVLTVAVLLGLFNRNCFCFLITFISDDDHRNLQIEVTFAPALGRALGRAHFSFQDRFTQSDGLLEGFSTVQTEHHHEQVSC